jgi:hypothetical protein
LPESSSSLGGVDVGVAMPDSSQSLPPLMHMGYVAANRHPGRKQVTGIFCREVVKILDIFLTKFLKILQYKS